MISKFHSQKSLQVFLFFTINNNSNISDNLVKEGQGFKVIIGLTGEAARNAKFYVKGKNTALDSFLAGRCDGSVVQGRALVSPHPPPTLGISTSKSSPINSAIF